jgi:hypothetical protein
MSLPSNARLHTFLKFTGRTVSYVTHKLVHRRRSAPPAPTMHPPMSSLLRNSAYDPTPTNLAGASTTDRINPLHEVTNATDPAPVRHHRSTGYPHPQFALTRPQEPLVRSRPRLLHVRPCPRFMISSTVPHTHGFRGPTGRCLGHLGSAEPAGSIVEYDDMTGTGLVPNGAHRFP